MVKGMTLALIGLAVAVSMCLPAQDCPELSGSLATPAQAWGITAAGNYVYLADKGGGLRIYDCSIPSAPVERASFQAAGGVYDAAVAGGYAYLAANSDFIILDVSNPAVPVEAGSLHLNGGSSSGVAVSGSIAVVTGPMGFWVVDISNPGAPALDAWMPLAAYTADTVFVDTYAYVANQASGIQIVDLNNPHSPVIAGTFGVPVSAMGLAVKDHYLYVAGGDVNFAVGDIANPVSPALVSTLAHVGGPKVAVTGNLALVPMTGAGLMVVDISNPAAPVLKGTGASDYALDVAPIAPYAYVADGNSGMKIFDFSACLVPSGPEYLIPAAAKAAGGFGTNWVTDAVLHNPGTAPVTADLYFLQTGQDNSAASAHSVTVNAGTSLKLQDLVGSLFGLSGASGAVRVIASAPLVIGSRTYNDQGSAGTYGQSIDGVQTPNAFGSTDFPRLIQLTRTADYRTNMGVVNVTASPVALAVAFYSGSDGSLIGNWSRTLSPYEHYQENNILQEFTGADVDDAYAVITTSTAAGRYFAYASVVDNRTGDPMFIAAR